MKETIESPPRLKLGAKDFFSEQARLFTTSPRQRLETMNFCLNWQNILPQALAGGLLIVLFTQPLSAQTQSTKPAQSTTIISAPDDYAPLTVRYPAAGKLRAYQNSRDYQYDYDAQPPQNPLAKFWHWFWQKIGEFFVSKSYQNFWQYVILAGLVGLVVWLLAKAQVLGFLFPKKGESLPLDYDILSEDIHAINFAGNINAAIEARNFRLAVRLLYLQTLKRLTDTGRISWKPDKTNRQYVQEMKNADFEQLTTQFEYVWYGDFPVDAARFGVIQHQFRDFMERR
jgi:Domain of unknown function (DUF4129)